MRAVFLNVWHAKCKSELTVFIAQEFSGTDIFCFQEADPICREHLRQVLPGFTEHVGTDENGDFDLATYVAPTAQTSQSEILLADTPGAGLALVTKVRYGDNVTTVVNVHGVSFTVDNKLDTPGRLDQSEAIITVLKTETNPVIVGGDFNLLPEAESIKMFSAAGYQDLVSRYQIKTTRNRLAWEGYLSNNIQYHADYVFTSPSVQIRSFAVLENEVSDHLPLIIEFEKA